MKKYRNRYFYTLVELLMAMAIFAIISVIMMRFFNSAQQIWSKASQKNVLYADARVVLDIMTAELQGALYDNKIGVTADPNNVPGIYPFWFEYKNLNETAITEPIFLTNMPLYPQYTYSADPVLQATYNKAYVTQLNFISSTPFKPNSNASNICEIKYIYLPVRLDNATDDNPTGLWNIIDNNVLTPGTYQIRGGVLARAGTGNLKSDGTSNFDATNTNCLYNFLLLPHDPAAAPTRVKDIFKKTSSELYAPVIDGIVDMKITCYTLVWDNALHSYALKPYNPMKCDAGGTIITNATEPTLDANAVSFGTLIAGSPFPVAVKIDLYMMAERDLREWLAALKYANSFASVTDRTKETYKATLIKNERMRCFSKTIYMSGSR